MTPFYVWLACQAACLSLGLVIWAADTLHRWDVEEHLAEGGIDAHLPDGLPFAFQFPLKPGDRIEWRDGALRNVQSSDRLH